MSNPNILVVDDAMDMRIYLKTLVKGMGYEPVVVRDGTEGLAAVVEKPIALILLDIMMPGEGGIIMYRALRQNEKLKHIPVLIHSAVPERLFFHYMAMEARSGHSLTPPDAYFEKPADPVRLKETIRSVMGGRDNHPTPEGPELE